MKKVLLLVLCLFMIGQLPVFSQTGSLDNTFSGDGKMLIEFGNTHDNGWDIITLNDNSSIILGSGTLGFTSTFGTLFRVLENGDIDSTFGADGAYTQILFGDATYPWKIVQEASGKILVAGTMNIGGNSEKMFVARYNLNGTHDATFGTGGYFQSSFAAENEGCETITLQADGKIVLAGRSYQGSFSKLLFARLTPDGIIDQSFGVNGYTDIDESVQGECINGLCILSNGDIVGLGFGYHGDPVWGDKVLMAKLDANGNPISSFGGNGAITPAIFTDVSIAKTVVERNDSLFVTGFQYDASNVNKLFVTKLDSDGNADPSFGTNGIMLESIEPFSYGFDLLLQGDGKILVGGTSGPSMFITEFFIMRLLSDGSYDNSWDGDGVVKTDFRVDNDEVYGLGMQADGKIMAIGFSFGLNSPPDEGNRLPIARYLNDYMPFQAEFSSSDTLVCVGNTVTFYDETAGGISRTWTFEGGTPATSTQPNPTVTYNTTGDFDVTLEASNGAITSTKNDTNYITVINDIPEQTATPTGDTSLCETQSAEYIINAVAHAYSYEWEVTPPDAGSITGLDTIGYFTASDSWYGPYTIKVRGVNICSNGQWSPELQCESYDMPSIYWLDGEGAYCTGSGGTEIMLDSSEVGVDYELYHDGTATGNIVAGTGSPISFGLVSDEGFYTSIGFSAYCTMNMNGQIWVHEVFPPEQPSTPSGPELVCELDTSYYFIEPDPDVITYSWALAPVDAGTMVPMVDSVMLIWDTQYTGNATLAVYGTNECGDSPLSEVIDITINEIPEPEITGPQIVCENTEEVYQTNEVTGNSYEWQIEGGTITSGAGTYQVTVMWGNPGQGSLLVIEENPYNCSTTTSQYTVTIDECTRIDEADISQVLIMPNPTKGLFTVKGIKYTKVSVYDYRGNLILESDPSESIIDLSNQASGIYIVHITYDKQVITTKLIKE